MFDEKKCPAYLVSDKENANFDEFALTNLGTLKKELQKLCTKLTHPVAVFDFVRLKKGEQSKYAQKIESDISFFSLRNSCKLLRQCAGDYFCEECDRFHASCMASSAEEIRANIASRLDNRPDFFYDGYVDRPPRVLELTDCDRPILEYHCPMMGYRELIFPIRYMSRVFGVLFVGQISVQSPEAPEKGDLRVIDGIRRDFFNKFKIEESNILFHDFVERFNKGARSGSELTGKELETWIMESDQNPNKYDRVLNFGTSLDQLRYHFITYESETAYHDYLKTVCKEIGQMEQALGQDYANKRAEHFDRIIQEITKPFYKRLDFVRFQYRDSNSYERYTAELKEMWDAIKQIAVDIKDRFPIRVHSVTVYGDGESLTVGNVNVKPAQFSYPSGNMSTAYDFTIVRGSGRNEAVNSITFQSGVKETEHPEGGKGLLDGLSEGVPRKNCVLIACRSIAIFLRVKDLQKYNEIYKALAEAIGKELEKINNAVVLSRANLQKEKHVLTLRMYRHETAHISERMLNLTDMHFAGNRSQLLALSDEKRGRVVNDMQNTISLLSDMADNVGIVTGSINETSPILSKQKELNVFNLLYKWRSMFHYQLIDRSLEIRVPRSSGSNDKAVQKSPGVSDDVAAALNGGISFVEGDRIIKINARLFELLVYNLVDNAVKYAYRGSNIYLVWRKHDGTHELRVISYGPEMKAGKDLYGLYARGSGTLIQNVQGEGIGLYAVKRICDLLDLEVSHESKWIAGNYLPFVEWYRKTDFSNISGYQKIADSEFPVNSLEHIVVNQYEETKIKRVSKKRLIKRIGMDTFCTTFIIKIKD